MGSGRETNATGPTEQTSADIPLIQPQQLDIALAACADPFPTLRDTLKQARSELEQRFRAGQEVSTLVRQHADAVDIVLVQAWRQFLAPEPPGPALVAAGGYGRGELHPASDIDILVLLDREEPTDHVVAIESFLTALWDLGIEVGHSVRTVAECVEEAKQDLTVVTSLMETRLLAGPPALFTRMRQATGPASVWSSSDFFAAKRDEQVARYRKYGDTAYNLEPNVKEGPGGLRDIQAIGWVLKRHFGADSLAELVTEGFLTKRECSDLIAGRDFLWKVRFALHVLTGRREDRLLFDHQRTLARELGYRDEGHSLAVEVFMRDYYRTIMRLSRLNEMLLQLFEEALLLADAPVEVKAINARFQARNGFVEATRNDVFERYPFALLEIFLILQQHSELRGVRASTIRLIRQNRRLMDDRARRDIRVKSLFLEIIKQPRGVTQELRRMNRYGLLARYLPPFRAIVGQMQYDLFHVYTVDEHTLFVIRNLRRFTVRKYAGEFPLCSDIMQRLPKQELIYLAALFHDIAKGRGGDHSELGAEDALHFCSKIGLSQYDARFVAWLVRHHLTMSTTAQRQDISDPDVINRFADLVGDQMHLDYLYLLTVADIRATNPAIWNSWKDALLRDLYYATREALQSAPQQPVDKAKRVADTQAACRALLPEFAEDDPRVRQLWAEVGEDYFRRHSADEIAWHTRAILGSSAEDLPLVLIRGMTHRGGTEIFIYTRDADALFANVTATLDQLGLTIVDARIITSDTGTVLDTFMVLEENGQAINDELRVHEIETALRERLLHPTPVPEQVSRRPRRQLQHFTVAPQVSFSEDAANSRTVMEVTTRDRPGLLSQIAGAMACCGIRLQNAKIATYGERAEDVFFITDSEDRPLPPRLCASCRKSIVDALRGPQEDNSRR